MQIGELALEIFLGTYVLPLVITAAIVLVGIIIIAIGCVFERLFNEYKLRKRKE